MDGKRLNLYGLAWFVEKGYGFYPATPEKSKKDFFEEYEKLEGTKIGEKLIDSRRKMIEKHICYGKLLDIGCGAGTLIKKRRNTWGYDVDEGAVEWLNKQSKFIDPYSAHLAEFNCISFFDSLEHIEEPWLILDRVTLQTVIITIPLFDNMYTVKESKHFKPNEHYWYFTEKGFILFMEERGFEIVEKSYSEIEAGREDVYLFVFKRP